MHADDKPRIKAYESTLDKLKRTPFSAEKDKPTRGMLRPHFTFTTIPEAQEAKRAASAAKREAQAICKLIRADQKTVRQIYAQRSQSIGSGSGLTGKLFGNKQKIIQDKAKQKRKLTTERDNRIADYEKVLRNVEAFIRGCESIIADATASLQELRR